MSATTAIVVPMGASDRASYRHGNLRADAIAAAMAIVESSGHAALSMRAVAKATGVAHRSIYNHFADRDELLNRVATEGYWALAEQLADAKTRDEYIRIYVVFATTRAGLSALMNSRPHATMRFYPYLQQAAHAIITEAMRLFTKSGQDAVARRRAVMKTYIILQGAMTLHRSGILDVDGEEGLVSMLGEMLN